MSIDKIILYFVAMTEPESTSSEMEERSANVSDADINVVRRKNIEND